MHLLNVGKVVVLAVSAVALVGCNQSEPAGDVARGSAGPDAIEVTIEDGVFQPDHVEVDPEGSATVEIRNLDQAPHDFAIPSLDLNTGVLKTGDVATAEVVLQQDVVEFECTLHDGMKGTITRNRQTEASANSERSG